MTALTNNLLIFRFRVRAPGGSLTQNLPPFLDPPGSTGTHKTVTRPATLVGWVFAPDWLTVTQAAGLVGLDAAGILDLITLGAVDTKDDGAGGHLIDKESLREYRDTLWEVLSDEW